MKKLTILLVSVFLLSLPAIAEPPQTRTVYILQDAHESLGAQEQIAQEISNLVNNNGIELVASEGGAGNVHVEKIRRMAPFEKIAQIAYPSLQDGTIEGVEYAYIKNPIPFSLLGAEDEDLYRQDFALYKKLLENRIPANRILDRLEKNLDQSYPEKNHKQTRETEQLLDQLFSSQFSIVRWFRQIDPLLRWQRIYVPENSEYGKLRNVLSEEKVSENQIKILRSMDAKKMQSEFERLIWRLRLKMAGNDEEKNRVYAKWQMSLMRRLCSGEMTLADLQTLNQLESQHPINLPGFDSLKPYLETARQFYGLARLRSYVMARHLLSEMEKRGLNEAVLVAGGFHTEDFERYFRGRNISVQVWTPRIDEKDIKIPYQEQILTANSSTIRKALFGGNPAAFQKTLSERLPAGTVGRSLGTPEELKSLFAQFPGEKPDDDLLRIFSVEELARDVVAGYEHTVDRLSLPEEDGYPEILYYAMDRTAQKAGKMNTEEIIKKINLLRSVLKSGNKNLKTKDGSKILFGYNKDGKLYFYPSKEAWEQFWDSEYAMEFFVDHLDSANFSRETVKASAPYKEGDDLAALFAKEIKKYEAVGELTESFRMKDEPVDLSEASEDIPLLNLGQNVEIKGIAGESGNLEMVFSKWNPKQIPGTQQLSRLFDDMEAFAESITSVQGPSGKSRLVYREKLKQRIFDPTQILIRIKMPSAVSRLEDVFLAHVRNPLAVISEEREENTEKRFFLSPYFGLFRFDEQGRIVNWDEAMAEYVAFVSGAKPDASVFPQAWKLYFPAEGILEREYSVFMNGEGQKLKLNAYQIKHSNVPLSRLTTYDEYVIVAPKGYLNAHPFLRLINPSKEFQLFRISAPRSGIETASRVTDVYERALVAGFLVSDRFLMGNQEPVLFDAQSGMREVDQLNPAAAIRALRSQLEGFNPETATYVYEGKNAKVAKVPSMSPDDRELFEPIPAQSVRIKDPEKAKRNAERKIADALKNPAVPAAANMEWIKDAQDAANSLASLAVTEAKPSAETKIQFENGTLKVIFKSGSGLVLEDVALSFILDGKKSARTFQKEETLGFQGSGRYLLAAAAQFLETQKLSPEAQLVYQSWRPFLLEAYRQTQSEGKSLGGEAQLVLEPETKFSIWNENDFYFAERLNGNQNLISSIAKTQQGQYELLVYLNAFKKGILFPNLEYLFKKFPGVKITIVDDHMTSDEIRQELKRRDPGGFLTPYLAGGQLNVPKDPLLEKQIKEAQERLRPEGKQYADSLLGIIFDDHDGSREVSAREMYLKTPDKSMRFVAKGKLDLGVVTQAAASLVRGTPEGLFDNRYQNENVYALSSLVSENLIGILDRYQGQIELQTSA